RIKTLDIAGNSTAGNSSKPGTNLLNAGHEGENEKHCPKQGISKLRTNLRVSGYTTRVVICCSCDQTRTQKSQESTDRGTTFAKKGRKARNHLFTFWNFGVNRMR